MCMNFTIRKRDVAVVLAICVVLSPVLIPIGICAAAGYGIKEGASAAKRKLLTNRHHRNTLTDIMSYSGIADKLQEAFNAKNKYPKEFVTTFEVAMCMFFSRDYEGALRYFHEALDYCAEPSALQKEQRGLVYYFSSNALQLTRQFAQCKQSLIAAAKCYEELEALIAADPTVHRLKDEPWYRKGDRKNAIDAGIDRAQCLTSAAYACYLQAIYSQDRLPGETRVSILREGLNLMNTSKQLRPLDSYGAMVYAFLNFRMAVEPLQATLEASALASPTSAAECPEVNIELLAFARAHTEAAESLLIAEYDEALVGVPPAEIESINAALNRSRSEVLALRAIIMAADGRASAEEVTAVALKAIELDSEACPIRATFTDRPLDDGLTAEEILTPWPLPSTIAPEEEETLDRHTFTPMKARVPTWCDQCMRFIGRDPMLRCARCGYECHAAEGCSNLASAQFCMNGHRISDKKSEATDGDNPREKHNHIYYPRRVHRCHKCDECDKFIMMMTTALQCNQCNAYIHAECAYAAVGNGRGVVAAATTAKADV